MKPYAERHMKVYADTSPTRWWPGPTLGHTPERWRDGHMVLGWVAAGMGEAAKQFRRVNGHLHLPALRAAVEATTTVTPSKEDAAA